MQRKQGPTLGIAWPQNEREEPLLAERIRGACSSALHGVSLTERVGRLRSSRVHGVSFAERVGTSRGSSARSVCNALERLERCVHYLWLQPVPTEESSGRLCIFMQQAPIGCGEGATLDGGGDGVEMQMISATNGGGEKKVSFK